jgi:hypothetical protein
MTLTECYAKHGIPVTSPRRVWSAQADDGTVVVTLWSDMFLDIERREYNSFGRDDLPQWKDRWENRRRIKHLKFARDTHGGQFQSIIAISKGASHFQAAGYELGPRMRLICLNDLTGEFRARSDA